MSWRTVIVTQRAKLDLKTGYLVIRTEEAVKATPHKKVAKIEKI